jgi:predicted transcriptional regulator
MSRVEPDHGLEFLLAFNGRIHYLEKGYWLKFEIVRMMHQRRRVREIDMKRAKVQSLGSLRAEMKAVARGERLAPGDAGKPSFNSVEAVVRLLTRENRRLLALIRDRKPGSVAELADLTGRAQPNLTRTLAKLEAAGFISMKTVGRRKTPSVSVKRIVVEIDPCSERDRLRVA